MKTIEEKKNYIRENGLVHLVAELNTAGTEESLIAAINYVYDSKTLSKADFLAKYFG